MTLRKNPVWIKFCYAKIFSAIEILKFRKGISEKYFYLKGPFLNMGPKLPYEYLNNFFQQVGF